MSKGRALGLLGSASLLLALFVVLPIVGADSKDKGVYRPLGLYTEVLSLVKSNYVEPVELKPLMLGSFAGMTEAMDPFAEYIPPEKIAAHSAAIAAREKKETIDAGLVLAKRFGYPVVIAAVPGSPAAAAGLRTDDILEKIDGQGTRALAIWEVDAKLSGKPGGRVQLQVVRDGKPRHRTFDVVRASWSPEKPVATRMDGQIVVRIPSFTAGTAEAVKGILATYDKGKPMVLDVRGNAIGAFEEAARTAALFVAPGVLAEMKGRKIETTTFSAEPGQRVHDARVVVLVDSGTAGAAELFAGALRDSSRRGLKPVAATASNNNEDADDDTEEPQVRATPVPAKESVVRLVGEPTFGMGFTSQVVKLASGGALKISVGKLRMPSGKSLSPRGLEPDDRVFTLPPDETSGKQPPDAILQRGLKTLAEMTALPAAA